MNESCHTYERVMSHTWTRRVTYMSESCDKWMSRVTHLNESCFAHAWVISHVWMSHVTHINSGYAIRPSHLGSRGVLHCVAVCVAPCCTVLQCVLHRVALCCSVCCSVCCTVLHRVAVRRSHSIGLSYLGVFIHVFIAVRCILLRCVAQCVVCSVYCSICCNACCSVLQPCHQVITSGSGERVVHRKVSLQTPKTLQHAATRCNTLQHTQGQNGRQNIKRQTLQGVTVPHHCSMSLQHVTATRPCNTHTITATCSLLQQRVTATHISSLQHTQHHCSMRTNVHTVTAPCHCNIAIQRAKMVYPCVATGGYISYCNTLQYDSIYYVAMQRAHC